MQTQDAKDFKNPFMILNWKNIQQGKMFPGWHPLIVLFIKTPQSIWVKLPEDVSVEVGHN